MYQRVYVKQKNLLKKVFFVGERTWIIIMMMIISVVMAWTGYKKAYDMELQSWIINYLKNIQYSRKSHKVYWENHEKQESGIDSRRKKVTCGENPERYIPGDVLSLLQLIIASTYWGTAVTDTNLLNRKKRSITSCSLTTSNCLLKMRKNCKP